MEEKEGDRRKRVIKERVRDREYGKEGWKGGVMKERIKEKEKGVEGKINKEKKQASK